jgi:hypothetical protein
LLLSRAGLLVLLAALASTAAAQQFYQWKDAKGVTHYSDNPPPSTQKAQNRRIDNRGAVVIEAPAAAAAENPQCTIARSNLALLSGKGAVQQDTDGDGKPDTNLDEQGRATQRTLAEASVKAYCKPEPAVGAAGS